MMHMIFRHGCAYRLPLGVVLVAMLLGAGWANAAENAELRIEVARFAFGNWIPNRSWTPMQTRLVNNGDQEIDAAVVLAYDLGGQAGDTIQYLRQIKMPPHTSRQLETSVLIDYPPEALEVLYGNENVETISFSDGRNIEQVRRQVKTIAFNVRAINVKTGQEYPGSPAFGRPTPPDALVTLVVDGDESYRTGGTANQTYSLDGLSYVVGENAADLAALPGQSWPTSSAFLNRNAPPATLLENRYLAVNRSSPEDLPRKWAAYEGVHCVILGNLRPTYSPWLMSPQQRHSLLRWVRSGGRLIIMPTHDLESYTQPFWQQLLPVRLLGRRLLDGELTALENRYGKQVHFDRGLPPLLADALPRADSETLVRDGNRALVARRQVGNGEVWFVAVTGQALADWSQSPEFFSSCLRANADPAPGLKTDLNVSAEQILSGVVGAAAPNRGHVLALLGGYLLLSGMGLWLFSRRGQPEYAWPLLMLFAALSGAGAIAIGKTARAQVGFVQGELGVTQLAVNEAQGSATSFVGFYAPRAVSENLHWRNADTLATGHPASNNTAGNSTVTRKLTVDQGDQFSFLDLDLRPGELRLARAMTLVNYGDGIDLVVGYNGNGLTGYVHNRTGLPLVDCLLRLNRRTLQIGNLAADQRRDLADCALSWKLTSADYELANDKDAAIRRQVLAELLRQRDGVVHGQQHLYSWPIAFYGWAKTVQADAMLESKTQLRQRPFQLLVVPVSQIQATGAVATPAGACGLKLLNSSTARFAYGDPRRHIDTSHVRLPQLQRLAGSSKGNSARTNASNAAPANASGGFAADTAMEPFDPTGWKVNTMPASLAIGFSRPQGLESMRIDRVTLVLDMALSGYQVELRVRRSGSKQFRQVLAAAYTGDKSLELALTPVEKFIGPNGELPEVQLRLIQPNERRSTRLGQWQINQCDLKLWGTMPEKQTL